MEENERLAIAGSWLQALTDGSLEAVALVDADRSVQYVSVTGAVEKIIGYSAIDVMNMDPLEVIHPLDLKRVSEAFDAVASHQSGRMVVKARLRHRNGQYVDVEGTAVNHLDDAHVAAVVVHVRSTEQTRPDSEVRSSRREIGVPIHTTDELHQALDEAISQRFTGRRFALVAMAIVRAEELVAAYGNELTHRLDREVGRRLAALLRPGDYLARLPNGMFAVILAGVGDRSLAQRVSERITRTLGRKFRVRGQDVFVRVSVGIATDERNYDRGEDVVRDALVALQSQAGHAENGPPSTDVSLFHTHLEVERTRHMSLLSELNESLKKNEFELRYMPVVSLATRTIASLEILLRWQHPERGLISPDLFVPIAEQSGLIVQLGRWALLAGCNQLVEWQNQVPVQPPHAIRANISPRQFADFDFDDQLRAVIKQVDIDPKLVTIELEERVLLGDRDLAIAMLNRIRQMGVRVSLDNFGRGPTSLALLRELPCNEIKLARELVNQIDEDLETRQFVTTLVTTARQMSLSVVAQGVERPAQAAILRDMMVDYASGYLFSRPLDASAMAALLGSHPQWWS